MKPADKRARVDWDAARRDWRTGKFTQVELADKHKVNPSTLNRKMKADQAKDPDSWQRDLTEAVRLATNARVITEMVKAEVKKGQDQGQEIGQGQEKGQDLRQDLTAVAVAAEMSANVILRHQRDLSEAREVAMTLLAELRGATLLAEDQDLIAEVLAGKDAKPEDIGRVRQALRRALDVGSRISSVKSLSDALARLQERERVAFSLDTKDKPIDPDGAAMGDVEAANRIAFLIEQAKKR